MSNNEERAIEKDIRRKPNLAKKQDLLRIRPDFSHPLKKNDSVAIKTYLKENPSR